MAYVFVFDHDRAGDLSYKFGDIVQIIDAGANGFRVPQPAPFRIINVTNLTEAQATAWMDAHTDASGKPIMRRLWQLDTAKMTNAQRNAFLGANRYVEVTLNTARKWLRNKITGTYAG